MSSEPELITNGNNNFDDNEPKSTSRNLLPKEVEESRKDEGQKIKKNKKKITEENKFIIEEDYLKLDECTAMTLGPVSINQKAFICLYCSAKKEKYICRFCYYNCHKKCRDYLKLEPKQEEFKGEKEFACFCANKLKHKPEESQKRELKSCDLLVLDKSLEVGLFYCENHKLSICCVCSVECHKKCKIRKFKDNNAQEEHQCLCMNENHTTYNEIALTFPLNEYQKLSGVAVWPIQILNILFNTKRFENLSSLFKSMLNKEEISEEKRKKFFPLMELFSNTFTRKFKTLYYEENIINMFNYNTLIDYIKNIEIDSPDMILLKFRLLFILLFVHLKNDFQTTKALTSIDFACNSILERIEYKKILLKKSVFNKNIYQKYDLNKLITKNHDLKAIIINDVCNIMALGTDALSIEEYSEEFEIGLKILCFMMKKMLFTKEDLIKLINSLYIFFDKFFNHINSVKCNVFFLIEIFSGLSELFLMISVNYNDIVVMNYLDKYEKTSNINSIELKDDFIHQSSEHGNKLFEMIMKSSELLKRHYDLLNNNEEVIKENQKKLIKDKKQIKKIILTKANKAETKLPESGGLLCEKIIKEFSESLGIFCLADNIYFKQIDSITKDDLLSYYYFCNKLENNKYDIISKSDHNKINDILLYVKVEIEKQFHSLFTSSYSHTIANASDDLHQLLLDLSSNINDIINEFGNNKNKNNEQDENININNYRKHIKTYIKTNKDGNEGEDEKEEKEEKNDKINHFLTKIAVKKKETYPFLIKDSFSQICEEFVDHLIISNLDETITKILVFFSNRKYPNLLTYDLLDIIYSTLYLYFFSKRGIKYLLTGKNLVRLNKVFNRYDCKSQSKNINPAYGKTEETNILFINKTFEFCLDFFKCMKLYDLSIKNHKVLQRFRKNMLGHICLFNLESKDHNVSDFLTQFKQMIKIFYYLSDDLQFEDLDLIKRQCVFILKQNPFNIFEKKSFYNVLNVMENHLMIHQGKESDKLALKDNIDTNKKGNIKTNYNNNGTDFLSENYRKIISLYYAFFKLYSIQTYYIYDNEENIAIMNILNTFNDLNCFKQNLQTNNIQLKQKIILLKYLRSVYFIDHLNEYSILSKKTHLTTQDYFTLIKCNAIAEEKFEKCLNLKEALALKANIVKDLMEKYNVISQLDIIIHIYLNEIKNFPKQMLGNSMELCRIFYRAFLFDIKFISNYFYCLKNAWSRFNLLFYQLCLEFIRRIDIFKSVFDNVKGSNDTIFDIGEEYYLVPLDADEEEVFDHSPALKKKYKEKKKKDDLNRNQEWDAVISSAYKAIQKLKSISFDIYNTKEIFNYFNEFINSLLKYSNLGNLYNFENYLAIFDETAEANFTPFSLLETLDYEYFYEEDKQEQDELIKKDTNLYKLKNLKDSFIEAFIDINNTNFMDILTKPQSDNLMFDPRKEYVQLFKSFINSNQGNNLHLLNLFLCILTKMLFYYSEGMQDQFEDFINDNDFFPNMNRLLNMYLVLVFSLTKNIYAYNFVAEINNFSKLIMQLLQALGEGFNTTYHNNIFKFQKDIPLIDEEDDSDNDKNEGENEELSSDEESKTMKNDKKNDEINQNSTDILNNLKSNKIYKTRLKTEIPSINVVNTIYDSLITNLKHALSLLDTETLIEGEMPYDKLIISITNIFDFIIEYIESEGENNEVIKNSFKNLLFGIKKKKPQSEKTNKELLDEKKYIDVLFFKIVQSEEDNENNKLYLLRKKIICYIKYKFANVLIYYLLTGGKDNMIEKLIKNNCSPIDLFSELVYNFKELLNNLKLKNPDLVKDIESMKDKKPSEFVDKLINCYAYEEDFRNMIEFPVIINLYILIKIYDEFYNHKEVKSHFESISENFDETSEEDDYNIRSKFSYCIYLFLEKMILKVEIKMDNEDEEKDALTELEENKNKIANLVIKNISNDPFINKMKAADKKNIKQKKNEEESESDESESGEENPKSGIKTLFFLRPYLTFTLSESSKEKFILEVDRSNASQKFVSLVHFSDYCLYEMVVNRHLVGNSNLKNVLANINYFLLEVISYIIIIINNCFIIYHFYKSADLPIEEYDIFDEGNKSKFYLDNIIISIIQAAVLILVIINWYFFEFINHFQYNVMNTYNKNFVFKKPGVDNKISQTIIDYFQDKEDVSSSAFFSDVNKNVSGWKKFYVGLFGASLFNREINTFLFTVILNILFLVVRSYLFLIVEILLIINIVPTLFDIFQAMKMKYLHILLVLLFDFLLVYIFMWFGFFFFQDFFVYDDILESTSGSTITESYCYSSVPCFLIYISLGTRAGGGITESMRTVSYQKDPKLFFARFFHDLLYFFIIILILGNVFLGIIIDTFGELRNDQSEKERDRNNICFICQLSSDACLTRNIDFDKHVNTVHNIWNYVYFLAYLHLNNPNNFNRVENSVWEKLEAQDYSWIPIDTSSED